MAVVDPGVGTARAGLAMRAGGHGFVGPDNGILSAPLKGRPAELVELAVPVEASATFHGRDLFAPAAAALARGVPLVHLGHPYAQIPRKLTTAEPRQDEEGGGVIGEVVYVDRFGNLITNLTPDLVPVDAVVVTEVLEIGPLRTTFGDVPSGRVLAYLGSGGEIEIGVRDGSAARVLGMGVGAKVRARFVNGER
jgi:S-adenosylmethionine hydrolase